jgi:hypothetical protein
MIRQRVKLGLKRAVARGKRLGRPQIESEIERKAQRELRKGSARVSRTITNVDASVIPPLLLSDIGPPVLRGYLMPPPSIASFANIERRTAPRFKYSCQN